ncbi:MAG: tRNA (adenosine(37)-N6)-threonylcarbamoyltransferase complex dimerization subunit type 1 TsaB [Chitinophagaceae bacterium]|nr:tRNA (adenosine(37)-N6)-threonylcarbamoyltransferase complex dimerization subunit type 1 TsaB [Chitinophagaceae bacterium]
MNYLLHIDTSGDTASICLTADNDVVGLRMNESRNDHASWLHPAIQALLTENRLTGVQLQAVSVSIGPGSYTGLRIGLSAAKGLCFAAGIPLITADTLTMMALAAQAEATDLICPLIDARRMEVFTALYDKHLQVITPPQAMILEDTSFLAVLNEHSILFCGNGSKKLHSSIFSANAMVSVITASAVHLATLALLKYNKKEFADLAYTEPLYIKEFYSVIRK